MTVVIVHVIADLTTGGAEMMLKRLVGAHAHDAEFRHHVISLYSEGRVGPELEKLGVSVEALGLRRASDLPRVFWRLVTILRRLRPQIVHAWMYHANVLASFAALFSGRPPVIWGIRASRLDRTAGVGRFTLLLRRCSAYLSGRLPEVIVYVARSAQRAHEALGYSKAKSIVIPNGYEPVPFEERPLTSDGTPIVVGSIGRFNAAKDPKTFVDAAEQIAKARSNVRFHMVGRGVSAENAGLTRWIADAGLTSDIVLFGEREDVYECLASMDVFCLHSATEAFPNVVAEAMNAGLPCVVTDVGDAAGLVGDAGVVVPASDAAALARAVIQMIDIGPRERRVFGERGRQRIASSFSLEAVVHRYEVLYRAVAKRLPRSSYLAELEA